MTPQLPHSEFEELLGAYAVDALDRGEQMLVEDHVRGCPSCRQEVESLREAIGHLSSPEPPAPPELWNRISSSLEVTAPPLNLGGVTPMPPRRQGISVRLASALAAAAVLVMGFMGFRLMQQDDRISAIQATTAKEGLLKAATLAAADPSADRVTMRSPDKSLSGDVVILPNGEGYLVSHNLPDVSPRSSYQLWALVHETRISLGLLDGTSGVTAFRAPVSTTGLAITQEVAGGVSTSQKDPVVVGFRRA